MKGFVSLFNTIHPGQSLSLLAVLFFFFFPLRFFLLWCFSTLVDFCFEAVSDRFKRVEVNCNGSILGKVTPSIDIS